MWDTLGWLTCCVWQVRSLERAPVLNTQSESTSPVVEILEICSRNGKSHLHWDGEGVTTVLVEKQCREV